MGDEVLLVRDQYGTLVVVASNTCHGGPGPLTCSKLGFFTRLGAYAAQAEGDVEPGVLWGCGDGERVEVGEVEGVGLGVVVVGLGDLLGGEIGEGDEVGVTSLTTWMSTGDVLSLKLSLPLYLAVIECDPTASDEVVKVATPSDISTEPMSVPPSKNTTEPVGRPAAASFEVTVAVKVTGWPKVDGFGEDSSSVLVGSPSWVSVAAEVGSPRLGIGQASNMATRINANGTASIRAIPDLLRLPNGTSSSFDQSSFAGESGPVVTVRSATS